jgi:hypothetical protein
MFARTHGRHDDHLRDLARKPAGGHPDIPANSDDSDTAQPPRKRALDAEGVIERCYVTVTQGIINNRHIYITVLIKKAGFLPHDVFGKPQASAGTGWKVRLDVEGLSEPIMTDVPTDASSGKPRKFFRERDWVAEFFRVNRVRAGDTVAFEKVRDGHLRVYKVKP